LDDFVKTHLEANAEEIQLGAHSKEESAMTDWQTYRNGNLRQPWDLERLVRHRAAKLGYCVHRSRRRKGPDNAGNLMLIHKASSTVLLGAGYTATVEMIPKFMERERMPDAGSPSLSVRM
jgi:predicted acetyltransferase